MGTLINKGQSLFEVVLVIGITSVVLVAIVNAAILSVKSSSYSRNKTLATKYSQEAVEWLRGQRDAGWTEFSGKVNSTWCLKSLDWTIGRACGASENIIGTAFKREADLTYGGDTKTINSTVRVYWTDAQGYHDVKVNTFFSDWRESQ